MAAGFGSAPCPDVAHLAEAAASVGAAAASSRAADFAPSAAEAGPIVPAVSFPEAAAGVFLPGRFARVLPRPGA